MSEIAFKTAVPPSGVLTQMIVRFFANRFAAFDFGAMGERERQDIGWGQMDRYSRSASLAKWRNAP